MNDLPHTATSDPANQAVSVATPISGSMNKEVGPGGGIEVGLRDATGSEIELPKEVSSAGVKVTPVSVPIPPPVSKMGVQPAGVNIPAQTISTIVLPLSDDQIVLGLKQGVTTSWLWLSAWCVRRLKQIHIHLQSMQGKTVRVKDQ